MNIYSLNLDIEQHTKHSIIIYIYFHIKFLYTYLKNRCIIYIIIVKPLLNFHIYYKFTYIY